MKLNVLLTIGALFGSTLLAQADVQSLSWSTVATKQADSWYASDEAAAVAENVLLYQRDNGGWMKNIQMHKTLTESEKTTVKSQKKEESCFDNGATTTEMRFLAKMYRNTQNEKYKVAFVKALELIFTAQREAGAWSQYYPLRGRGYWDYLTFNDDLTVNILKLLNDIAIESADFVGLLDDAMIAKAKVAYDKGVQCILDCQIVDNGVKTVWCAQHDPETLDPAMGRPHEFPSFSGGESCNILKFLMSITNPSDAVKEAVVGGVEWLKANSIKGYRLVDVKDESGNVVDRVLEASEGSEVWARFTQLGGEIAERVYKKQVELLSSNDERTYYYNKKVYYYSDADNAKESYNPEYAYKPVYGIYDDTYPFLRYRFLYNHNETDPIADENGVPVNTSLRADNRRSYDYIGDWAKDIIASTYPKWRLVNGLDGGGATSMAYISQITNVGGDWTFTDGYSITNEKGKGYSAGKGNTVKYSSGVVFTIHLPEGVQVKGIEFYGYCNYDEGSYVKSVNGVEFAAEEYVFPGKIDGEGQTVSHSIELDKIVENELSFCIGGKQVAVEINLILVGGDNSPISSVTLDDSRSSDVYTLGGVLVLSNATPSDVKNLPKGIYIYKGRIVVNN